MDFYFDENIPVRVARAVRELEKINNIHSTVEVINIGSGIKDINLIPKIKELNGILVTFDLKMITRANEFELIKENGITVFAIKVRTGAEYWEQVMAVLKNWEIIKDICNKKHHPFVCLIKTNGTHEFK